MQFATLLFYGEATGREFVRERDYWTIGAAWIAEERASRRPAW